jgi:hypothetical protein
MRTCCLSVTDDCGTRAESEQQGITNFLVHREPTTGQLWVIVVFDAGPGGQAIALQLAAAAGAL